MAYGVEVYSELGELILNPVGRYARPLNVTFGSSSCEFVASGNSWSYEIPAADRNKKIAYWAEPYIRCQWHQWDDYWVNFSAGKGGHYAYRDGNYIKFDCVSGYGSYCHVAIYT